MRIDLEKYPDYKYPPARANLQWRQILANDPDDTATLERFLGMTQAEAVDDYIEESCWSDDMPHLIGHKGTPELRRLTLSEAYLADCDEPHYSLLTPLEYQMHKALSVASNCISNNKPAAEEIDKAIQAARDHVGRLMKLDLEDIKSSVTAQKKRVPLTSKDSPRFPDL